MHFHELMWAQLTRDTCLLLGQSIPNLGDDRSFRLDDCFALVSTKPSLHSVRFFSLAISLNLESRQEK